MNYMYNWTVSIFSLFGTIDCYISNQKEAPDTKKKKCKTRAFSEIIVMPSYKFHRNIPTFTTVPTCNVWITAMRIDHHHYYYCRNCLPSLVSIDAHGNLASRWNLIDNSKLENHDSHLKWFSNTFFSFIHWKAHCLSLIAVWCDLEERLENVFDFVISMNIRTNKMYPNILPGFFFYLLLNVRLSHAHHYINEL